ncbi:MAG: CmcI family methyltransferase [Candidatus Pacebacteria bacterium]|nr:CmcI family methyltransferase [Candidatus Paceibacterota bacterium]
MNKQKALTILQKKIKSQGNIPTFFDNLIYDLGIKEEDEKISTPILNFCEQLLNSKSNRFSNYEDRIKENCSFTGDKRSVWNPSFYASQGTHSLIEWKGLSVYKTAYDFVIYWMLISELKPNTIIEYGSGSGGSAIWLADISTAMGLDINVISYDIKLPNVIHPKVQFVELDLEQDFVEEVHRPGKKLVIEDAHVNVKSVLLKTDLHLKVGDYLIVEDIGPKKQSEIIDFLSNAKNTYKTDNYYLDFFGRNTTCCVDSIFKVF